MGSALLSGEMKGTLPILADAFVAVGLLIPSVIVIQGTEDFPQEFTGTVTGLSSYNQPKLDLKAETIMDSGIPLGSEFTITTESDTYESAVFVESYLGIFMFDIFVNVETDGTVSIGCMGELITEENGSTVTITYSGRSQTYRQTPLYDQDYSKDRGDFPSDVVFANFYEVTGGDLVSGKLYRSFSPLYAPQKQSRSPYVNQLAEEVGIQYEIALSYNNASVAQAVAQLEGYCIDLCKEGNYLAPGMGYLYFQQKDWTRQVLESIKDNDGPYLVHCNVGRDRTGYIVLLLQALCGCSADEMQECEARAFVNLYGIEPGSREYDTVVKCTYNRNLYLISEWESIVKLSDIDWKHVDVSKVDTKAAAYTYCTGYLGMDVSDVDAVVAKLCA